MKQNTIYLSGLCADACFTLGKIVAQMNWEWHLIGQERVNVRYPKEDEDMFEFICGEFI